MADNLKLLLRLFWQPAAAMSAILDRGSLLFASVSVLAVSLLFQTQRGQAPAWFTFSFYAPLLVLAVVYVPGVVLLNRLLAGLGGSLGAVFERDFSPLLICAAMAWAAANLPLAAGSRLVPAQAFGPLLGLTYLYFAVLMFLAVRTVFGTEDRIAFAIVCLSWIPLAAAVFLLGPLRFLFGWIASPFFLFYAYRYLGGEVSALGEGLRRRQNFRRMLEAAAINPHDGEAQYQLGIIYQERHQYTEAIQRFKTAIAINPGETDAHFQLGRIAREQSRLKDALAHFQTVLDLDEKHSQSEILRELGAVYLSARQFEDAIGELTRYIDRRPYDPEGLFYYGQALEGSGRLAEAREIYERAAEAARVSPGFRRRITAKWSRLAQKQLRRLAA